MQSAKTFLTSSLTFFALSAVPAAASTAETLGLDCKDFTASDYPIQSALNQAFNNGPVELPRGQTLTRLDESTDRSKVRIVAKVLDDNSQMRRIDFFFNTNEQKLTVVTVIPEGRFMFNGLELETFTVPVRSAFWNYPDGFSIASNCSADGVLFADGQQSLLGLKYFGSRYDSGPAYYSVLGKYVSP